MPVFLLRSNFTVLCRADDYSASRRRLNPYLRGLIAAGFLSIIKTAKQERGITYVRSGELVSNWSPTTTSIRSTEIPVAQRKGGVAMQGLGIANDYLVKGHHQDLQAQARKAGLQIKAQQKRK